MIFAPRFYLILALSILLSIASLWVVEVAALSLIITVLLLAAALTDLSQTPHQPLLITRRAPEAWTQGQPVTVNLQLHNRSTRQLLFQVLDSPPTAFAGEACLPPIYLQPASHEQRAYTLCSHQRGVFTFGDIFYRTTGPLGLIQRQEKIPASTTVYVFPDVSATGARELALQLSASQTTGRRPHPWLGTGREFESLREYQPDDDFRHIDWKASAKRNHLIVRQYQAERDQRVLLMLDLGRLMGTRIGSYSKLDYAVNAAVRLAQTALAQGDLVGLLLFNHDIAYYLPPHKGRAQLSPIVQALVTAQPNRLESNYAQVFHYAAKRNRQRTLFVCFTDLLDLEISQALVESMRPLLPHHLPMTVTISDSALLQVTRKIPVVAREVYEHAAAQEVWDDYQRSIRALHSGGVTTVNVPAQSLTLATLNRYLEIKRTARL